MTIRRSHRFLQLNRAQRKRADRRGQNLRVETLEDRRLLATGPQLVGIQPNQGELLKEGQERNEAPQDLTFLFNAAANIDETTLPTDVNDPSKLDSLQIWRSGLDGEFEVANAASDFNTGGTVVIGFEARQLGQGGNFVKIDVSKSSLGTNRKPLIDVVGKDIFVELNTRSNFETRAIDLVAAINIHPTASQLVTASILRGFDDANIAEPIITYSPIQLSGANAATAFSNFNSIDPLEVRFNAAQPGPDGNGIQILVDNEDLGFAAAPRIIVDGKEISLTLNSNQNTPTTAGQMVAAINTHPEAGLLVEASITVGEGTVEIGENNTSFSPIVLNGADDERIVPGYVGLGDTAREVIMRFREPLVDDLYMIDIFGTGPTPLADINGDAFQDGTDFQRMFELNLGAQVVAVVPQPVTVNADGSVDQARDQIVVYFNDDDLDSDTAEDPRFYQLIYTRETVENVDDLIFEPTDINYDPDTDMAVLTFAAPIEELRDPRTGESASAGSFRLRIGTDEARPLAPRELDVPEDPGSAFATARNLDQTGEWNTGDVMVVRGGGNQFQEGQQFTVIDVNGTAQRFEFDTGFIMQIPAAGGDAANGGIADGDKFTISQGSTDVTFEFDSDGTVNDPGSEVIDFNDGDSQALMAILVSDAISAAGLGLTPTGLGNGRIHLGGDDDTDLDTSNSPITQTGQPGAQDPEALPVPFIPDPSFTAEQVAQAMATSINGAPFDSIATATGDVVRFQLTKEIQLDSDFAALELSNQGVLLNEQIVNTSPYLLDLPGASDEQGHRDIPLEVERHLSTSSGDTNSGVEVFFYNFQDEYGELGGRVQLNAITETQKQRAREVFEFYSSVLGVQFIESANRGFTIVTGDMRVVNPFVLPGPGDVLGIAGNNMAIMDVQDFQTPVDNEFGGAWFETAMHEIGHLLGLGHTYDLPPVTIQGDDPQLNYGQIPELVFPGNQDIVHGQHLHRPEVKDIDLYRFELIETGVFTAETTSERLVNSSLLDSNLQLYKAELDSEGRVINRELIASNDDYYSTDSFIEMLLDPGIYYVGVAASGNDVYDPQVEDSGFGGRSEGRYQLRLNFRPDADNTIVDTTDIALDGDADGLQGGVFNFWFRAAAPLPDATPRPTNDEPRTLFVNKFTAPGGNGSPDAPFNNLEAAVGSAREHDIVRVVGNAGADGDITTLDDNLAFEVGFSRVGNRPLADGSTLEIPKDVTLMMESGSIMKLRRARIGVGSSAQGLDRSGGGLQVLGVPRVLDSLGEVRLDETGRPIVGSVYFTSIHDEEIGSDTNPDQTPPDARAGDWGGILFRNDVDQAAARFVDENEGIFVNYVNHADMRYGGGSLLINGITQVVTPVQTNDARPTITHNRLTKSADAAISANPDSFEETNFHAPVYQQRTGFTSDYDRVGPSVHHNTVVENSINGLFVRVDTPAGQDIEKLTVSGRWDDKDITHVLAEALVIQGQPGGPVAVDVAPPVALVKLDALNNGTLSPGTYNYRVVFVDAQGVEGPASSLTSDQTLIAGEGTIRLDNLPTLRNVPQFVSRRLYRSDSSGGGRYTLVSELNGEDLTYIDDGATVGGELVESLGVVAPRFNGRLAVDPSMVVKLDGARFEVELGAELISEGLDGQRVVMTSLRDRRYGAGGTFDTKFESGSAVDPLPGDWAGVFLGHLSKGSLDHTVIAYAGGVTRIEGRFTAFNPVEIHQADVRIAHSVFEMNADGIELTDVGGTLAPPNRFGRGTNEGATIFVRGAQPVIVDNRINFNEGYSISVDANSLNSDHVNDPGRVTGGLARVGDFNENQGALISGNQLDNDPDSLYQAINGLHVRAGTMTTQGVWDDANIVHVVTGEINVPDFHTFGGLRLESQATESLVVKLTGTNAGFTATGRPLEITDRIGGSLQIVGQPRFPVVLTSLEDDSVGAGFTPNGVPQTDTNGDGGDEDGGGRLPTGPEIDNGTLIDNDVAIGTPGQFAFQVLNGGSSGFAHFAGGVSGAGGGVTVQGNTQLFSNEDAIFEFFNFLDVGGDGNAIELSASNVTTPATLIDFDFVISEGSIQGENGTINWRLESQLEDGIPTVFNTLKLSSTEPLGNLQFINYLDEDIPLFTAFDDLLWLDGTPGTDDFRAFTLDGPERIGFSQGGFVEDTSRLVNATYDGWAADKYDDLLLAIRGAGSIYTVPGNIDTTDLTPLDDPELGRVYGLADITTAFAWSVDPTATTATITSVLDLVPRNPSLLGTPGDWRSIKLDQFSHDRNVEVSVEREASDLSDGPDNNQDPSNAQYLGMLAPGEKSSDDSLRLGFEVHGVLSSTGDVDVYSFDATAGTEVWLDIDRTTQSLDTIVELVDGDGGIIALSDDSFLEEQGAQVLYADTSRLPQQHVNPLRASQSDFYPESAAGQPKDEYSINPQDAGMRIVLPGSLGTTNTYHVRVRSNNLLPGDSRDKLLDSTEINSGLTSGIYQLQVRLHERDEFPGSTVQYADIRFATNGIEILGQPVHSPLGGEVAEDDTPNQNIGEAQPVGNLLNSDRAVLGITGIIDSPNDVDFFDFSVRYDAIQNNTIGSLQNQIAHVPVTIDVEYADGLVRPNTRISIFDSAGNLVLHGLDSNIGDDQPGPLTGSGVTDLSRGSVGTLDAYIGTVLLPEGDYTLAVTNDNLMPQELEQFYLANASNPLFRLEPVNSIIRVVDDHTGFDGGATADNPLSINFLNTDSIVPFHLGDVGLFVSHNDGTSLSTLDPFTGVNEVLYGNNYNISALNGARINDIAIRPDTSEMFSFSTWLHAPAAANDANTGVYVNIDLETGQGVVVGDDNLETYESTDGTNQGERRATNGQGQQMGVGYHFRGITYRNEGGNLGLRGYAVGSRPQGFRNPPSVGYTENVLYWFNPDTGVMETVAGNPGAGNRPGGFRWVGAGTQIRERGQLITDADPFGQANSVLIAAEATEFDPNTQRTNFLILDGTQFGIDDDGDPFTPPVVFEFNSGPEVLLTPNPSAGNFLRDGDTFTLDGVPIEFDTGSVIVVNAANGNFVNDGDLITITNDATPAVTRVFEFDKAGGVGGNNTAIPINNGMTQAQLTQAIVNSINGDVPFGVSADPLGNRVTLRGESPSVGAQSSATQVVIEGQPGGAGGNVVRVEETSDRDELGSAIRRDFGLIPGFDAGWEGSRVNFAGAVTGDFTAIVGRGVFNVLPSDGTVSAGAVGISFLAHDTAEDIARRINSALLSQAIANTQNRAIVNLVNPAVVEFADPPLQSGGAAPGGEITGLAFVGGTMYGVSDAGGLFRILNHRSTLGAFTDYVETSAGDLTGINFQGLAKAPVQTEDGLYQDILIGIDNRGTMYAFDTNGILQPVFVDANTSIDTGFRNVVGLDFSTLQDNPWSIVGGNNCQANAPGHGINAAFDGSRGSSTGGSSFHLGNCTPGNNYAWAGGAYGAVESEVFSLEGYAAEDKPTLYYNYFLDTENRDGNPMWDSFRVFAADESGEWELLTTNNSDEFGIFPNDVQDNFDSTGTWRQARISLEEYAGRDHLQLRFDFSTAGERNYGDQDTTGVDLRFLEASVLRDGETFQIDGDVFELDLGFTLVAPTGGRVTEGSTFTIDNGDGATIYEFDSDGFVTNAGAVAVEYQPEWSAGEVAESMHFTIRGAFQPPVIPGSMFDEPNDTLVDAVDSTLLGTTQVYRAAGEIGDNAEVEPVQDVDMVRVELRTGSQITIDVDAASLGSTLDAALRLFDSQGNELRRNDNSGSLDPLITFTATQAGTYFVGVSGSGNLNYDPRFPASGSDSLTVGSYELEMTILDPAGATQIDENRVNLPPAIDVAIDAASGIALEGAPGVGLGSIPVLLNSAQTSEEVTDAARQAIAATYSNGVVENIKSYSSVIQVIGHDVVDSGPFGLTSFLPADNRGRFFSLNRFQRNDFEGVYVDDVVIGFAEHGEMGTGTSGNANHVTNRGPAISPALIGDYHVEVRTSETYGVSNLATVPSVNLTESFGTNDRLTNNITVFAPAAYEIGEGQTFTLSDGVDTLIFEFDDVNINDGVTPGYVEIDFDPQEFDLLTSSFNSERDYDLAAAIREAINSPSVQNPLNVTAGLSDGTLTGIDSTDNRVNLYGTPVTDLKNAALELISTSSDPNALVAALLGPGFSLGSVPPEYIGGASSSGFFRGGSTSIGIEQGIVLTTGDARFAEGPNTDGASSGTSSLEGDEDLDTTFAVETLDTTSLEFTFVTPTTGDLFFDFVFASEEYNEFVGSQFNDVFAFYIDGENVGLIPGTTTPVSINTVNGGNPFGVGGVNEQFYVNNDPDDGGLFLEELGYDGFTTVFTASKNLLAGEHTVKLAISDVGDTQLDSAVFIQAFNSVTVDNRNQLPGAIYVSEGDENRERDQGQIIIHSNTVRHSLDAGILVDAGARDDNPHAGPVRLTRLVNNQDLLPGVVVTNNIVAYNRQAGIVVNGDPSPAPSQFSSIPFGRILNNTVVGTGTSDGIVVGENASPTILNNIITDSNFGILVDVTSTSTVVGGTLYAGNLSNTVGVGLGSNPLILNNSDEIFVNKEFDNFYLQEGTIAIDSSIDSLRDRNNMAVLRESVGIAPSPVLAPDRDITGQLRVDDPDVSTPTGLGQDVFKDRGAMDRSDFAGPSAILINPRDNDAAGLDRDPRTSFVEIAGDIFTEFSVQLIDGIQPSNQAQGTGPDDVLVVSDAVLVTKDGQPLQDGVDYLFSYNATSNVVRLTPLAGIWEPDSAYEIQILNDDVFVIDAVNGGLVADETVFTISDSTSAAVNFEFDSGYGIQVPLVGGSVFRDGNFFLLGDGSEIKRFEFDDDGATSTSAIAVPFTQSDSVDEIADSIVVAIASANLGLNPQNMGDGFVHVGGEEGYTLSTGPSPLTQTGTPGVAQGNVPIKYIAHPNFTAEQMADAIADAINGSSLFEVSADARLADVIIRGAQSVSNINARFLSAVRDLAGNELQPNRFGGGTEFTVFLGAALDYGDAPANYPVLKEDNGASHEIIEGFTLGDGVTSEIDGKPSPNADADEDDGVFFTSTLVAGFDATVTVRASGITPLQPGFLDAWIDFNGDGDWQDANEQIFDSAQLINGNNNLTFNVAGLPRGGLGYARFRLSTSGGLSSVGRTVSGEVEDYQVAIEGNPWQNPVEPKDVNQDGFISPIDALLVINYLNFDNTGDPLPVPPTPDFQPPPFLDVSGDGFASPQDALIVINYLNDPTGSGEGESGIEALPASDGLLIDAAATNGLNQLSMSEIGTALARQQAASRVATSDTGAVAEMDRSRADVTQPAFDASRVGQDEAFARVDYRSMDFESVLDDIAPDVEDALDDDWNQWG